MAGVKVFTIEFAARGDNATLYRIETPDYPGAPLYLSCEDGWPMSDNEAVKLAVLLTQATPKDPNIDAREMCSRIGRQLQDGAPVPGDILMVLGLALIRAAGKL